MNLRASVSSIMTPNLITANPRDRWTIVKEIFDEHRIHHIPVVCYTILVGLISKSDFLYFHRGINRSTPGKVSEEGRVRSYHAEVTMTTGLAKLESNERIDVAMEVSKENFFHGLPVVDNDEIKGIITTLNIMNAMIKEFAVAPQN